MQSRRPRGSARLPRRARLAVAAVAVLAIAAAGAGAAAIQYGAWALDGTSGVAQTGPAAASPRWIGYDLRNRAAVPITLRAFVPRRLRNVRVLESRVVDVRDGSGFGVVGSPLPPGLQRKLDASRPVAGTVIPAGSRAAYEVVVLVEQVRTSEPAEVGGATIAYSALGFDQGAAFDLVSRFRAG